MTKLVRGFSFIELLVTVFIIIMLTGLVTLGVGSGALSVRLEDEVRNIASLLSYVASEAELSAENHGLFLCGLSKKSGTEYRGIWLRHYKEGWANPRPGVEVFNSFSFEEDYDLILFVEGQLEVEVPACRLDLNPTPQIVLSANGEITPGALQWVDPLTATVLYRLEWDLIGRMVFSPQGEVAEA